MLISLIGMPGGGKSTVGRQLARRLAVDFIDTDAVVEQRVGMTIPELFERDGEAAFRAIESDVLAQLARDRQGVLATGGGIVLAAANREILRRHSTVVYLKATPRELVRRVRVDGRRPLLAGQDPLVRLRQLYSQRDPLYRETAHFVIETGRPSVTSLVNIVLMQLEVAGLVDPDRVPSPVARPAAGQRGGAPTGAS
ncbi:MAG TPA: shikimate kinase [Caldimonas sp.]|nr:shikimate kinase [Caldimonas sp.]